MAHPRALQTPEQILAFAKENQWQNIQVPDNAVLNEAVKLKSLPLVESIIKKEYDVALRRAIVGKAHSMIALLIPLRVNINSGSTKQFNRTALHFAAQLGMLDVIEQLVKAGAYVNMVDNNEFTPTHLACQNGHAAAALLLARLGAYPAGSVLPSSLIPSNKLAEFSEYRQLSQINVRNKMLLPSGLGSQFTTLIEPNNVVAAITSKNLSDVDESDNLTLEGMLGEGRVEALDKIKEICVMRGILILSAKKYIDLDKVYRDVLPMHLTQMLLRYGNFNNDNELINCKKYQMTQIVNLGIRWAEIEASSETKFNLVFRNSGLDSFFLLSEATDLTCDSKHVKKTNDGKLLIEHDKLSDAIQDLKKSPIKKPVQHVDKTPSQTPAAGR
jgi:hypothetical protein